MDKFSGVEVLTHSVTSYLGDIMREKDVWYLPQNLIEGYIEQQQQPHHYEYDKQRKLVFDAMNLNRMSSDTTVSRSCAATIEKCHKIFEGSTVISILGMILKEVIVLVCWIGVVSCGKNYHKRGPVAGGQLISTVNGGCIGSSCGVDFNPILLQGVRGYPGIRARINQRSFQYASGLIEEKRDTRQFNTTISKLDLQMFLVQGCVQIYNLYVSRYRCPQRVVLYPAPPNRVIIQVQNVDIGITGNLGGQIVVLLPIPLTGIVQMNAQQVTITVDMSVERGANGPYVRILSCSVNVGYADAYIENGGLIGDIINSQFRQRISSQVREMIPSKVCGQLPSIINEKLNSRLAALPQLIAVTQLLTMFGDVLPVGGRGSSPSQQYSFGNFN
ncbi:LBP / BPI / CETP family protein [Dictyocaulus viviparus]|uniref:LBP / BPI / CETP family protein n=1 Tax=Dictyocaulus viviparus TaxID=29172 RepID=A0A0D8XI43_DICVI|nr:LBP / BPI / CETP family protein [Dictyocaulus viviparus]